MKDIQKIGIGIAASIALIVLDMILLSTTDMPMSLFWVIFAVSMIVIFIPFLAIGGDWVRLEEDRISIDAPMAKFEIPYDAIRSVDCVGGFKPGLRTYGYGGIRRGSGDFTNDSLGHYRFAGSTAVDLMIVVSYTERGKEKYAAFNLKDEASTMDAYNRIRDASKAGSMRIDPEKAGENAKNHRKMVRAVAAVVLISVAAIIVIIAASMTMGHVDAWMNEDSLEVDATMMHEEIPYEDIDSIELRDDVSYGVRVGGLGNANYLTGNFKNDEFGKYRLAVHTSTDVCIVVHTAEKVVVFNLGSDEETKEFHDRLQQRVSDVVDTTNTQYIPCKDVTAWNPTCRIIS